MSGAGGVPATSAAEVRAVGRDGRPPVLAEAAADVGRPPRPTALTSAADVAGTPPAPLMNNPGYSVTRRSRSAFAITDTELKLIATLAIIGDSRSPKIG